ncbi:hypothetical protein [Kitasatospora sp. NPDC056184]|uniref:hypothetical protein n=1 Tax=Kitasatospora sp. NPDC056184 TaxID=3345738 RepID=UPI0035D55AFE
MGSAGRPQGRLKGETEQADALARFVREVTTGLTVRELAQRYPAGKTSWSEYRSAEKDIPWHLLRRLVHDRLEDPRARAALLARAGRLHEQAARAARGPGSPAAGRSAAQQALDRARQAQRLAEAGAAESAELVRVLVAIVGELRGELGAVPGGAAAPGAPGPDGAGAEELRRARLREATRCLAEVRRIRQPEPGAPADRPAPAAAAAAAAARPCRTAGRVGTGGRVGTAGRVGTGTAAALAGLLLVAGVLVGLNLRPAPAPHRCLAVSRAGDPPGAVLLPYPCEEHPVRGRPVQDQPVTR